MPNSTPETALPEQPRVIRYGHLRVDLVGFTVSVDGRDVPLTYSEFLLFKALLLQPTQVLDRAALMAVLDTRQFSYKHGWSEITFRAIDIHMSRIRRKLAVAGYDCIKTMRYVGYRFIPLPDATG